MASYSVPQLLAQNNYKIDYEDLPDLVVLASAQSLTTSQQDAARNNIGAVSQAAFAAKNPGVVLIESGATTVPANTPVGTVVFRKL